MNTLLQSNRDAPNTVYVTLQAQCNWYFLEICMFYTLCTKYLQSFTRFSAAVKEKLHLQKYRSVHYTKQPSFRLDQICSTQAGLTLLWHKILRGSRPQLPLNSCMNAVLSKIKKIFPTEYKTLVSTYNAKRIQFRCLPETSYTVFLFIKTNTWILFFVTKNIQIKFLLELHLFIFLMFHSYRFKSLCLVEI